MSDQTEISFKSAEALSGRAVKRTPNAAIRILLLGDFGGQTHRRDSDNDKSLVNVSIIQIDIDNFAAVGHYAVYQSSQ